VDWANEEYVRVYTRETTDDVELSWQALALWRTLLTKFDRSGLLPIRNGWSSVAKIARWPVDVVEAAGPELVRDGRIRMTKAGLFAPNYVEAQTASKSDKLRQRESRDRRRDETAALQDVEITQPAPSNVTQGHAESHAGHDASRNVTLCSALPPDTTADPEAMLIPPDKPAVENAPPPKRARKTRLPDNWEPTRSIANLEAERTATARGVDLSVELLKLRDWALSSAHRRSDWDSVWRNWTRNARSSSGSGRPQNHSPTQVAFDELARLEREEMLAKETS
jgi:hypothetical protein